MNIPRKVKFALLASVITIPTLIIFPSAVNAATSGSTALSLTVNAANGTKGGGTGTIPGYLTISAPASLNLGSSISFPAAFVVPATSPVSVGDGRFVSMGWTSQVVMSDLTPTAGGAIIPASIFAYDPGVITDSGPGSSTGISAANVTSLVSVVNTVGVRTNAVWTPSISVTEPLTPADGAYTGTMTSSVF